MTTITTATHTLKAYYTTGGPDSYHVDVNGDTLADVVQDMLDFWNDSPTSNRDFEVTEQTGDSEYTEVIIEGTETYQHQDNAPETSDVRIVIIAEEK